MIVGVSGRVFMVTVKGGLSEMMKGQRSQGICARTSISS